MTAAPVEALQEQIIACEKCPRLTAWCREVAIKKRKSYDADLYWGKPVPSFGDPSANLLVVGLAPGAHGANRTGRMFTGDRSGNWLYRALHRAGFSNQAESTSQDDGLRLKGAWISAVVHCAPPDNKPKTAERDQCLAYLIEELRLMEDIRVIVALGRFAWDGVLLALKGLGFQAARKPAFSHGCQIQLDRYLIIGSYHPSQQNTFTGRLTEPMLDSVFDAAAEEIGKSL